MPELPELLDKRDWTGAATLIEFERKVCMENKRASGWKAGPSGEYEWVEGGSAQLTDEERTNDATRGMWLAYCYTHLGQHKKALDTYQALLDGGASLQAGAVIPSAEGGEAPAGRLTAFRAALASGQAACAVHSRQYRSTYGVPGDDKQRVGPQ